MPKADVWFVLNRFSGIAHKMINGKINAACHIEEVHYERKARKLSSLKYGRLCERCFKHELQAA